MVDADAIAPRWPAVRPGRGHYESFYLRAVHPSEPRGVWIRYTVTVLPDGRPEGQLWCTYFAGGRPPQSVRVPVGEPDRGDGAWIRFAENVFGPDIVSGAAPSAGCPASWELRFSPRQEPLRHLPRPWMYRARLPRTKLLSPVPVAVFDGTLEIAGETVTVDGWPGMVGHNWGEEHAEEWIWLSGLAFDDAGPDTWLDVAVGRVRIGPVTTPWIANGAISLDGVRRPLGGLGRRVGVTAAEDGCVLRLPGRDCVVTASASAPVEAFVVWDYANPNGSEHRVLNCSVADLSVRVERPSRPPVELCAPGRAAYEWGRRDDGTSPPS
jgi:hypothetical protein